MSYPQQWIKVPLFKIKNQLIIDDLNKLEINKNVIIQILKENKISFSLIYCEVRSDITLYEISLSSDKNLSKTKILSAFANKNVKIFTELEVK